MHKPAFWPLLMAAVIFLATDATVAETNSFTAPTGASPAAEPVPSQSIKGNSATGEQQITVIENGKVMAVPPATGTAKTSTPSSSTMSSEVPPSKAAAVPVPSMLPSSTAPTTQPAQPAQSVPPASH